MELLVPSISIAVAIGAILLLVRRERHDLPLPPGPARLPFLGSVLQMPRTDEYLAYTKWRDRWGDIIYAKVFDRGICILGTYQAAKDLLDKRGAYYSDRPRLPMVGELVGWTRATAVSPFNDRFRQQRKLLERTVGGKNAENFWPHEERETKNFLIHILNKPEDLIKHIRRLKGTVILEVSHGYHVKDQNDPLVELADKCMEEFSLATSMGFLVDLFPILKYVPAWFPFAGFKRTAAKWRQNFVDTVEEPFAFVKREMAKGTARPSFTSQLLAEGNLDAEDEENVKYAAFGMYTGNSDTAVAAMTMFFLLMVLNPDAQAKAQAEIDKVTGGERLPTFKDRSALPYTEAIMSESLRWGPITPISLVFPHRLMKDDQYQGYRLPEGTLMIPNIWAMLHDETLYKDPMAFNPDRFIGDNKELDPRNLVFGFGRRHTQVCPGRALADAGMWLSIAVVLATFNIRKATDEHGKEIEPVVAFRSGTICRAADFEYSITPRSSKAEAVARRPV
ncbi:cytochrome P450 [Gautieria morchelliformis]|nr:cytochrome P450 [Gautieria morchelliformis]